MLLLPSDFFLNKRFKKIYEEHYQAVKPYGSLSEAMPDTDLGPNCLQTG